MIQKHKVNIFETLGRNPVHPFPARMSPGIALSVLKTNNRLRVLDPMMGSGTVLAVARHFGHKASGVDLDPLAVLISKVWTTALDPESFQSTAAKVLDRAKERLPRVSPAEAYPEGADSETKAFIRFWFDTHSRRQLAALADTIRRIRRPDERNALWCAFSRLIITKKAGVSLAMDLSHSRPHKKFETSPIKPFSKFLDAARVVGQNVPKKGKRGIGPKTQPRLGDARNLRIRSGTIDLVLTSPPYLNAIDYMRCSKFSLVWMGFQSSELRAVRSMSIGSESGLGEWPQEVAEIMAETRLNKALTGKDLSIFARYVTDMNASVKEVARVLTDQGRAIYVVGNSSIKGTFVKNSSVVEAVAARNGLTLVEKRTRRLPADRRYLPAPNFKTSGQALKSRMRQEVVMAFAPTPMAVAAR